MSAAEIVLRDNQPGEHRAACPECARTEARPHDTALAVKVEPDGHMTWLCHRCGWRGTTAEHHQHVEHRPRPRPQAPPPPDRSARLSAALALYRSARPILPGTPAATYLARRDCALPHPEGHLRWLPDHQHKEGWRGPALVALVTNAASLAPLTVHRTWVLTDGSGKAPVERPRLYWPGLPKLGGVVRLWPDDEVTIALLVGEGIETVLTAALAFTPVWSCLDKGNLELLPVLPGIEALTIVADNDPDGGGERAAELCARRWTDAGCEVRIWIGEPGQDFNDALGSAAA